MWLSAALSVRRMQLSRRYALVIGAISVNSHPPISNSVKSGQVSRTAPNVRLANRLLRRCSVCSDCPTT
ncbi:hypothetical protein PF005_g18225 [Phytophthora fragariae]|uniref:Uncharacterized protein n=2 Tax=Phytophthora TaxID=4783 RepID=A0A6A3STZ5_9STRA|nr:hypothetical protein PF009_g17250 [Phytophthora fragariae]KAE9021038.1 hypothetical protein PR002_g12368 [Phytophthora rubi]KAE8993381.1 hypothetical protein PF011_g17161 [Phytophthora fragariae]KAE9036831.1 hypothetical protein PR001_g8642 [Phytophthora rubi]KAE9092718.1 hypothetical protein PF010_g17749 [Phytophthora fragariae]